MTKTDTLEGSFDFELDLDNLIERLSKIKTDYPLHSNLRFQIGYGYESATYYKLVGDREETEKEALFRVTSLEKKREQHIESVRKEAEKLGLL